MASSASAIDLEPAAAGLVATTFDDYRAQVRAALEAMPRPRVLIGASLGGLLAAACAGSADALVLVNPLPPAPWSAQLPQREWPDVVPWRRDARLASTRRALADADDATALFAFRRWRDESGAVLRQAQSGIEVAAPECPVLCIASARDEDVPAAVTAQLAAAETSRCACLLLPRRHCWGAQRMCGAVCWWPRLSATTVAVTAGGIQLLAFRHRKATDAGSPSRGRGRAMTGKPVDPGFRRDDGDAVRPDPAFAG